MGSLFMSLLAGQLPAFRSAVAAYANGLLRMIERHQHLVSGNALLQFPCSAAVVQSEGACISARREQPGRH